jgi:Holliday junction resolvase RusA-like endonuclease
MADFQHTFWLPFPPSVNRIWRYQRGKAHLSANYVNWKKQADAAAQLQKLGRLPVIGTCALEVKLSDAFKRFGDVDNRLKAVADFCQRIGLIVNDRYCRKASIEWDSVIGHDCTVTLSGEISFSSQWEFARYQAEVARKNKTKSRSAARSQMR